MATTKQVPHSLDEDDPLLQALFDSYSGAKRNVGALRRAQIKRNQYDLMKEFFENEKLYSDPKRFAIAPSIDEDGNIVYGWEDFAPYVQSGMYRKVLERLADEKNKDLIGFYSSPRDYAVAHANHEGVGWEDEHLYNPEDPIWNTIATSPSARHIMMWGMGWLPEKAQSYAVDDVLAKRRPNSAIAGDVAQDALRTGVEVGGAVAGGLMGGAPGAVAGGALGGGLSSLVDDGIDYLRTKSDDDMNRDILSGITDVERFENGHPVYGLPENLDFEKLADAGGSLSDYRGAAGRAALEAAFGGFASAAPFALKSLAKRLGGAANVLKVAFDNGDNPVIRKELIYQGLRDAADGTGYEARQVARYLERNGIKSPTDVPDEAVAYTDRIFTDGDTWDKLLSEPYEKAGLNGANEPVGKFPQIEFGVPSRGELEAATREEKQRLMSGINSDFVEDANAARRRFDEGQRIVDEFPREIVAATARNPKLAKAFLPENARYQFSPQNTGAALGAIRQALPEIMPSARAAYRSADLDVFKKAVANAKRTRSNDVKKSDKLAGELANRRVNANNSMMMPVDRGAQRLIETNPNLFEGLGQVQAHDAAVEILKLAGRPDHPLNRVMMENSRNLLPEPGRPSTPKLSEVNRDHSIFAKGGEPHSEGLARIYNAKNAKWYQNGNDDVTDKVLKAAEQNSDIQNIARANVNPEEYVKHLKEGSVKKGMVKSGEVVPFYRLTGKAKTQALKAMVDAAKLPIAVGGATLARRAPQVFPQFFGGNGASKTGEYTVDLLPESKQQVE